MAHGDNLYSGLWIILCIFKRLINSGCWKFGHSSAVFGKCTVFAGNLGIAPPYLVNVSGFIGFRWVSLGFTLSG